jgi:TonB-linked SusC/RagA family outer membrane protein
MKLNRNVQSFFKGGGLKKCLLIMKLTLAFFLFFNLQMSASLWSQSSTMSVKLKNSTLQELFNQIEKGSGYRFFYNNDEVDVNQRISVDAEKETVGVILTRAFKGLPYSFRESENKLIVIERSDKETNPSGVNVQQAKTITGKVTDQTGAPLSGVSVVVKGTTTGTLTDNNGSFSLSNIPADAILQFSFIGMKKQEITIGNNTTLSVGMQEEARSIDEVIVVGYGKQKNAKLTSSVAVLKTDEIKDVSFANMGTALAGRVAGVIVQSYGGEPGSTPSISIRGGGTPLYVIDGLTRDEATFNALNKEDIASISFLKDAAASAVYGARSSEGIVLVTTKQGEEGKLQLTYSNNLSYTSPINFPKLIDSYSKAISANAFSEANGNGTYAAFSKEELEIIKNGSDQLRYPNTDWYGTIFRSYAPMNEHNLTVSGGTKQTKYHGSLGYLHQGSNYVNDAENYDKFTYRSNVTTTFDKAGLDVSLGLNGYYSKLQGPPVDAWEILSHVIDKSPLERARNLDGTIASGVQNPLAEIYSPGFTRNENFFTDATLTFVWNVPWVKGLKATALGDYSFSENPYKKFFCYAPQYYETGGLVTVNTSSTLNQKQSNTQQYNLEFHLDYSKTIGKHTFEGMLVSNAQGGNNEWFSAYRDGYISNMPYLFAGDPKNKTNDGAASEWGRMGYVGRVKYDFAGKYLVELNGRYDGSDNFPEGKRFGFFPSVSLGWVVSKEDFFSNLNIDKFLNSLKLRGSYGVIGNDNVSRFSYLSSYSANSQVYVSGGTLVNGYSSNGLASENITWYSTKSLDYGLDFAVLDNHLKGSFDYFYTRTSNYLTSPAYGYTDPLGTSLPQVLSDAAFRKAGVDGSLNYSNNISEDFSYNIGFNFTAYQSLWEMYNEDSVTLSNPYTRTTQVNQNYLTTSYSSNGLYQSWDEVLNNPRRLTSTSLAVGDISYVDTNGDGKIDAQDFRRQGKSTSPRFVYGVNFSLKYKGFALDGLLQGTGRRDMYVGSYLQGQGSFVADYQMNYWTVTNTGASLPRPTDTGVNSGNNFSSSNFWIVDATYIRLKTLTLSYDLKKTLLKNVNAFKEFSLHVSGTNLLTISPCKKYFDPEVGSTSNFSFPVVRTISFGLRTTF